MYLRRVFLLVFLVFVFSGMVLPAVYESRLQFIVSKAVGAVGSTGVLFERTFVQSLPESRFPVILSVSSGNLSYPSGLDGGLLRWAYGNVSGVLGSNVSSVAVVFASLGLRVDVRIP